ncbi:hypothetical protein L1049_006678 [Liquidambar formosana]|uniref:Centromere protein S n=1 Tax=Liquidambar formosana TaxID=63359 RepID=A0AAP0RG90_LIQFO
MKISHPIVACISDLAFKYTEQLAKDLELFAQYAGHKSVNMEDVILSAHRKKRLATTLRSFCNNLKGKNPNLRGNGRSYQTRSAVQLSPLEIGKKMQACCGGQEAQARCQIVHILFDFL